MARCPRLRDSRRRPGPPPCEVECPVRPAVVLPANPVDDGASRRGEARTRMLPDTLFCATANDPLDDPVLLRRVGRDELLAQAIVATGRPEPAALEDEPVVATALRGWPRWAQSPEAGEARGFHRPFRLRGPAAPRVLGSEQKPLALVLDLHIHLRGPLWGHGLEVVAVSRGAGYRPGRCPLTAVTVRARNGAHAAPRPSGR